MYKNYPEQLCQQLDVRGFIYDRSGYGKSPGDLSNRTLNYLEEASTDLHQILTEHVKGPIVLYGHSDGGTIALLYASKYPKNNLGIITEAAHVFVEDLTIQGIKVAVKAFENKKLDRLEQYHGRKYETTFWAWANTWLHPDFKYWNIERFLPQISVPQLIIQGEHDQYATLEQVYSIQRHTQGVTTIFVPPCKHAPFKEKPALILKKISQFIHTSILNNG